MKLEKRVVELEKRIGTEPECPRCGQGQRYCVIMPDSRPDPPVCPVCGRGPKLVLRLMLDPNLPAKYYSPPGEMESPSSPEPVPAARPRPRCALSPHELAARLSAAAVRRDTPTPCHRTVSS